MVASFVAVWLVATGVPCTHGALECLAGSCYIVGLSVLWLLGTLLLMLPPGTFPATVMSWYEA